MNRAIDLNHYACVLRFWALDLGKEEIDISIENPKGALEL
jgi:hypothetical protein